MKPIQKTFLITISSWIVIYLSIYFIMWDFYFPFKWILQIPNFTVFQRLILLSCMILYGFIIYMLNKVLSSTPEENDKKGNTAILGILIISLCCLIPAFFDC